MEKNHERDTNKEKMNKLSSNKFIYHQKFQKIITNEISSPNKNILMKPTKKEQISKNIETILSHKQSLTTSSLTKEVSRNFGFKSTSRKTSAKIKSVLDSMIAEGSVKLYDDVVELN